MNTHCHIWRYDDTTPTEESPWIVTIVVDGQAIWNPPCFPTYEEAVGFTRGEPSWWGTWQGWVAEELADRQKESNVLTH